MDSQRLRRLLSPLEPEPALASPRRADRLLGALVATTAVVETVIGSPAWAGPTLVATLVAAAAVIWRRVRPLLALVVVQLLLGGLSVASWLTATEGDGLVASAIASLLVIYAAVRWGPPRASLIAAGLVTVVVTGAGIISPSATISEALWGGTFVLLLSVIALYSRSATALERHERRERELLARSALANDIHDSVAHHMSAIALRAEGARSDPGSGHPSDAALEDITSSARAALADMRRLVDDLRSPDPTPSHHSLADLDRLGDELGDARVRVSTSGDDRSVPAKVSTIAYLIAREGLTNARRHARAASTITIEARTESSGVVVQVADDGIGPAGSSSTPGGHGLRSMSERARSIGGTFAAGPRSEGGWLVQAELPFERS